MAAPTALRGRRVLEQGPRRSSVSAAPGLGNGRGAARRAGLSHVAKLVAASRAATIGWPDRPHPAVSSSGPKRGPSRLSAAGRPPGLGQALVHRLVDGSWRRAARRTGPIRFVEIGALAYQKPSTPLDAGPQGGAGQQEAARCASA